MNEEVIKAFKEMIELFSQDVKDLGNPYKFITEDVFRYYFFKSIHTYGPIQEAKYPNSDKKVDLIVGDNLFEFKFNRKLLSGATRPMPYDLGKLLSDFTKLVVLGQDKNKYLVYICDQDYLNYLNRNYGQELLNKEDIIIDIHNPNYNATISGAIGLKDRLGNKLINIKRRFFEESNGFYFYLYEIISSAEKISDQIEQIERVENMVCDEKK